LKIRINKKKHNAIKIGIKIDKDHTMSSQIPNIVCKC